MIGCNPGHPHGQSRRRGESNPLHLQRASKALWRFRPAGLLVLRSPSPPFCHDRAGNAHNIPCTTAISAVPRRGIYEIISKSALKKRPPKRWYRISRNAKFKLHLISTCRVPFGDAKVRIICEICKFQMLKMLNHLIILRFLFAFTAFSAYLCIENKAGGMGGEKRYELSKRQDIFSSPTCFFATIPASKKSGTSFCSHKTRHQRLNPYTPLGQFFNPYIKVFSMAGYFHGSQNPALSSAVTTGAHA